MKDRKSLIGISKDSIKRSQEPSLTSELLKEMTQREHKYLFFIYRTAIFAVWMDIIFRFVFKKLSIANYWSAVALTGIALFVGYHILILYPRYKKKLTDDYNNIVTSEAYQVKGKHQ